MEGSVLSFLKAEWKVSDTGHWASIFMEDLPKMHPTKFRFIWQRGFRGEDFLEIKQSKDLVSL
jgi:hypothetical protein